MGKSAVVIVEPKPKPVVVAPRPAPQPVTPVVFQPRPTVPNMPSGAPALHHVVIVLGLMKQVGGQ